VGVGGGGGGGAGPKTHLRGLKSAIFSHTTSGPRLKMAS